MSYNVKLAIFEGPMDLLLYLVKKEEIDIYKVPLAKIIDEYLNYMALMKELDINIASEFLIMASTLLEIKSKMLLPKPKVTIIEEDMEEDDGIHSAEKLLEKLDEYQKFKQIAQILCELEKTEKKIFPRPQLKETDKGNSLAELSVDDLVFALQDMLERKNEEKKIKILPRETITVEEMKCFIAEKIEAEGELNFIDLFSPGVSRLRVVTAFVALLELIREKSILVSQKKKFDNIIIQSR